MAQLLGRTSLTSVGTFGRIPERPRSALKWSRLVVRMGYSNNYGGSYVPPNNVTPSPMVQKELVRIVRDRTGFPANEVQQVMEQVKWHEEAAIQELNRRAHIEAEKKSARVTTEGLFGITHFDRDKSAAIVEINCETDSVVKNDRFQKMVLAVSKVAAKLQHAPGAPGLDLGELSRMRITLEHRKVKKEFTVHEAIVDLVARTRENIKIRRAFHYTSPTGVVGSFWHLCPNRDAESRAARILGLCKLEVPDEHLQHESVGRLSGDIATQIVCMKPMFLSRADVRPELLEQELNISRAQAAGGRTSAFDKMVDGRIGKYYEDVCLLEQKYVALESKTIQELIDDTSKVIRAPVKLLSFDYMQVGEGLDRSERNFAMDMGHRVATVPNRPQNYQ